MGGRHNTPATLERVTAWLVGGFVGWLWHIVLNVDLIRLVIPKEPPHTLHQALITALLIGLLSGSITSIAATAIYRAKFWQARPLVRFAIGGLALGVAAVILSIIAAPSPAL